MKKLIIIFILIAGVIYPQSGKKFIYLMGGKSEPVTKITFTGTATGNITMRGTGTITVDWGDGLTDDYTLTGSNQNIAHTYSGGTYSIKIYKPEFITYWYMQFNTGSWTITSKGLSKANLTYYLDLQYITGIQTINSSDLPNLTYLLLRNLSGTQTINSSDLPNLIYLYLINLSGTQTINSSDLPNLTYLLLRNLSGTQTINSSDLPNLIYLYLVNLSGTQTINSSDLPNLTYLHLENISGTYSGNWSAFSAGSSYLYYNASGKAFNITDGTFPAWTNTTITIIPTGTGYTTAEIDDFLNGWAPNAGTGTKTIDLRGANEPRSSSSDAAVTTLTGKGKTILTNP